MDNLEAGVSGAGTSGLGGETNTEGCLSAVQAAEAAEVVGQMADASLGLEAMEEIQEQLAEQNENGGCSV